MMPRVRTLRAANLARDPAAGSRALRVPFELGVFGLAVLALFAADRPVAAIVFGAVAAANAALLMAFDQLDR